MPEAHELEPPRAGLVLEGNHLAGVCEEPHRGIGREVRYPVDGVDVHAGPEELADEHSAGLHRGLLVAPVTELREESPFQLEQPGCGGLRGRAQGMRRLKMARPTA